MKRGQPPANVVVPEPVNPREDYIQCTPLSKAQAMRRLLTKNEVEKPMPWFRLFKLRAVEEKRT